MREVIQKIPAARIQRNVHHRKDDVSLLMPERAEIDERMRLQVVDALFVLRQPAEHCAVLHVVAVQQQVLRLFRHRVVFVKEDRARRRFVLREIVGEVIAVVAIDHGQVEHVVDREPRDQIRVLRVQRLHLRKRRAAHALVLRGFDGFRHGRDRLPRLLRGGWRRRGRFGRHGRRRFRGHFFLHVLRLRLLPVYRKGLAVHRGKLFFKPPRLHIARPKANQLRRAPDRHAEKAGHHRVARVQAMRFPPPPPADGKRAETAVLLRLLFLFPPLRSALGACHRKLRLKQAALGSLCAAFRALLRQIQCLSAPFRPLLRRIWARLGGRFLHRPFARRSGRLFLRLIPVFALTFRRIFRLAGHDGLRRPAFMLRRSSIMSLLAHVFRSFCTAG